MTQIFKSRTPNASWDIVIPDGVQEVFADGVADVMYHGSHVRLSLFQNRPLDLRKMAEFPSEDNALERREVAMFLTMPLPQFVEAFTNILRGVAENYPSLLAVQAAYHAKLQGTLDALRAAEGQLTSALGERPPVKMPAAPAKKRTRKPK